MKRIETIILKSLIANELYCRKVLPYLKSDYFKEASERIVYDEIAKYIGKYNSIPTSDSLGIAISSRTDLFDTDFKATETIIEELSDQSKQDINEDWLLDETESFCKERALHNAVLESIQIMDPSNKKQTKDKGSIPGILQDALAISFDPNVGHDYLDDSDSRFEFYHRKNKKYPFHLDYFNRITNGGLEPKTLNIIMAGTNVGKSMIMCDWAANWLSMHYNVLYITLEMSEEKIAQRIDANLLNVDLDDLLLLPKDSYVRKMDKLKSVVKGKLIVKEYPTASAGANHFRSLLNELYLKKQFKPDIICIDYMNICSSSRMKMGGSVNSYTYVKAIAEELRGLAQESNTALVTATQLNRSGFSSSDPGLEDTSESFGGPMTADWLVAAITSEDLEKLNQLMIKQLKSRYGDVTKNKRFVVGVDRAKQKLKDISDSEQHLVDSGQEPSEFSAKSGRYDKFKFD